MLRLLAAGKEERVSENSMSAMVWSFTHHEDSRNSVELQLVHAGCMVQEDPPKTKRSQGVSTVCQLYLSFQKEFDKSQTMGSMGFNNQLIDQIIYSPICILPHISVPTLGTSDMFFRGSQFLVAGRSSFRMRRA